MDRKVRIRGILSNRIMESNNKFLRFVVFCYFVDTDLIIGPVNKTVRVFIEASVICLKNTEAITCPIILRA